MNINIEARFVNYLSVLSDTSRQGSFHTQGLWTSHEAEEAEEADEADKAENEVCAL